jgi:putative transposase
VFPVATMCRVLDVSTSGYYAWRKRKPSKRALEDRELLEKIRYFHKKSRGTYGAPRIHRDLIEDGISVSRKRVARLMREAGLEGISRRKKVRTTVSSKGAQAAPDLVERNFTADAPDRLWVSDITYVRTSVGFLYLAVVLDAFSRRIVGWAMSSL